MAKSRGERQTAYQILVASSAERLANDQGDLWDSGQVESDETIHIPYAGQRLRSSQQVFWKVRVWDKDGQAVGVERAGHLDDGRAARRRLEGQVDRRAVANGIAAAAARVRGSSRDCGGRSCTCAAWGTSR